MNQMSFGYKKAIYFYYKKMFGEWPSQNEGGGGVLPYVRYTCYVRHQRVRFLSCFGLK